MKLILTIQTLIIKKGESFDIPDNTIFRSQHDSDKYLDEYLKPYIDIDFKKENLVIFYIDPSRKDIKCNALFQIIESISGVTKDQIKDKAQTQQIVFARQLFHYGFMECVGTLKAAGKETNRNHTTVIHSLKVIKNTIQYGNGWRKKMCLEFIKELTDKEII